jgi:hypothetical protein
MTKRSNKYTILIREKEEIDRRRSELRILSAKNGATQILKTIASWSEKEKPKGRDRKIKTLEKILKQIREPRYGVTLRALGLVFCSSKKACPRELRVYDNATDEFIYESMKTARILLRRLRKSEPQGLNIGIFKYKDLVLGITEHRYVNTFWNDSLTEEDRLNQLHHAEKCLAGLEEAQKRIRYIADHPDEVEAERKKFTAELEAKQEAVNQRKREAKERERRMKLQGQHPIDDGNNNSLDNWSDCVKEYS